MLAADRRRELLLVVDPVLEEEDGCPFAEQRGEPRGGRLRVVRLDAEEDVVRRAHLGGVVGRGQADLEVAGHAADAEAAFAERAQVLAAGDQVDVRSREREPAAEVAADAPGSEDRHPHDAHIMTFCHNAQELTGGQNG